MSKEKLIISSKKYRGESTVVSVRLPMGLLKDIDKIADDTGRTRNEVIQKCLFYAVENIEITDEK